VGNEFEDIKFIPQNTLLWGQLDVPSYRHHLYLWRNWALQIVRFDTIGAVHKVRHARGGVREGVTGGGGVKSMW